MPLVSKKWADRKEGRAGGGVGLEQAGRRLCAGLSDHLRAAECAVLISDRRTFCFFMRALLAPKLPIWALNAPAAAHSHLQDGCAAINAAEQLLRRKKALQ